MKIATIDLETDPFRYGITPYPFAAGFFDGDTYHQTWGDNCIAKMIEYLIDYPEPLVIYAHNGGGFDFWYLEEWINNPLFFIHGKIAKCGFLNRHELRDSYRMIPVPLASYEKDKIDYNLFTRDKREKHKKEIGHYLQRDCELLYEMINDFISRFQTHLTIGSASIKQMRSLRAQKHESEFFDQRFRPWYVGGRNQCFATGELKNNWKIYDTNSMYPDVMRNCQHPYGSSFHKSKNLPENKIYFAKIIAESNGALPIKEKGGLTFPTDTTREFMACSHEINMGLDLGLIRIKKVIECNVFNQTQTFEEFVDKFIRMKIECDESGDKGGRLFAKLFLNAGYGKYGQNPNNYMDCKLFENYNDCINEGYKYAGQLGEMTVGQKKAEITPNSYNNVAIAASITSAARAKLLLGLSKSVNPIYCDTDSIICTRLDMPIHDTKLGAWKMEAEADTMYIAGKKLYAAYKDGEPVMHKGTEKKASKGANLSADTIRRITLGETFINEIPAPTLRFNKQASFVSRTIKKTA